MEGDISEPSRLITVVEALNEKYSEENCTCDDFAHIQITSRQGARGTVQVGRNIPASALRPVNRIRFDEASPSPF